MAPLPDSHINAIAAPTAAVTGANNDRAETRRRVSHRTPRAQGRHLRQTENLIGSSSKP
jgi:hypothetical protein